MNSELFHFKFVKWWLPISFDAEGLIEYVMSYEGVRDLEEGHS